MLKLSVIIPCYNEEKNIPILFERVLSILSDNKDLDIEVILVENGSNDNSKAVFKSYETLNAKIKLCYIDKNIGYGNGILKGLEVATGDMLAWTHADMQTDFADVIKAYNLFISLDNINYVIKGKRKNRSFLDNIFTFGMQIVVMLLLKVNINDINAQPKLFSRDFYNKYINSTAPLDFSLDLYLLYMAIKNHYKIKTIDVFFNKRLYGEAKGGGSLKTKYKLIIRTLKYIFLLRKSFNQS
jgi:glycosyltransferase involved in cell wall biosynthesis